MIERYWERHNQGREGVINSFFLGKADTEYQSHIFNIVSSEANLMAYGVSPKDKRLVGSLAQTDSEQLNFQRFGYLVFCHEFKQRTGWKPDMNSIMYKMKQGGFKINPKSKPDAEIFFVNKDLVRVSP